MLDGDPLPPAPKSLFFGQHHAAPFPRHDPVLGSGGGTPACTWLSDRPRGLGWRLPALLTGRARFLSPEAGFFSRRGKRFPLRWRNPG